MISLSAIERANPPPRRKSCQACIKAKRRCDLGQPACLRCTQRLLECQYSTPGSAARRNTVANTQRQRSVAADLISIPPLSSHTGEGLALAEQVDYNNLVLTDLPSMDDPSLESGLDFLDPDLDMLQFINDTPTEAPEYTDKSSCATAFTIPRPPTPLYNNLDLIRQTKGDLALPLQAEGSWGSTALSFTIQHRLQFSLDLVKDAPRRMTLELQTPWCHPDLYRNGMPRSMQGRTASH